MTEKLITEKKAYEKEGHVFFLYLHLNNMENFQIKILDDLKAGARVEVSKFKKDPLDLFFGNLQIKMIQDGHRHGEEVDLVGI